MLRPDRLRSSVPYAGMTRIRCDGLARSLSALCTGHPNGQTHPRPAPAKMQAPRPPRRPGLDRQLTDGGPACDSLDADFRTLFRFAGAWRRRVAGAQTASAAAGRMRREGGSERWTTG